jgi:hypothetical protein
LQRRGLFRTDHERAQLERAGAEVTPEEIREAGPMPLLPVAQLYARDVPGLPVPEGADLLPDDLRRRIRQWEKATGHSYQSLSIADGWKVGGYASWHLTDPHPMVCECGRDMRLLLTIASGEWDGSRVWRPVEDADEDSEFHSYLSPDTPTHVTIGRGYSLWVFRCPDSFEHRHRMTMQ